MDPELGTAPPTPSPWRRLWGSGLFQIWFWSLVCLGLTVGSLTTTSLLSPLMMWFVLLIVLRGGLSLAPRVGGLRDWQQ